MGLVIRDRRTYELNKKPFGLDGKIFNYEYETLAFNSSVIENTRLVEWNHTLDACTRIPCTFWEVLF